MPANWIDALGQIEGSESKQLLLQTLEVSAAPKEIAMLARSLEGHAGASWRRIAKTLGGEEYRFRSEMFERTSGHGASLGKPSTVITGLSIQAHHKWSDAEIDQRIELIDRLSRMAPVETTGALEKARARLSSWRETRLVAGVRGAR